MELLLYFVAVLLVLISLIYWYIRRSFSYWESLNVPHNEPVIPFGNSKGVGKTVSFVNFMHEHYKKFRGTGKIFGFYTVTRPVAVLLDLDLIKTILIKEFPTFSERRFFYNDKDDPLSGHLVALNGQKWKNIRVKLTPTFTSGKMKFMFPTIAKIGDRLTQHLHEAILLNGEFEMKEILARFTMDVIGNCAFGIECNTLKDTDNEFYRIGRMAMDQPRFSERIAFFISDMKTLVRFFRIKVIREEVSSFFMSVVKNTIGYREENHIERNDFMDLMIKLKTNENDDGKTGLTVNQIAAQCYLFFVAGYETSVTTMLFALYELSLNQPVQQKLRKDIQDALKSHGEFSYEMMMSIPYLDQTINETLRKYPPFTVLSRITQANFKIPDTDLVLEKGMSVMVPVYGIHHDPKYYPDPEKFDPDRFTPEAIKERHQMAWLAFGDGPRNCIAARFGMMQTRIGLITLLNSFEFLPCSRTQTPIVFATSGVVLSPKDGIYLQIKPIQV